MSHHILSHILHIPLSLYVYIHIYIQYNKIYYIPLYTYKIPDYIPVGHPIISPIMVLKESHPLWY